MIARRNTPHRVRQAQFLLSGLAALIVTAACSGSAGNDMALAASPEKVTLAVPALPELVNLPVVLAERLGYYADESLDVKLVDVGAGSKAVQAVISGDAQAASGFAGHPISMAAKGQSIRSFVTTMNSPGMVLAVSPATRRSIDGVVDLRGGVVGVSAPGAGTHMLLNLVLDQLGLAPGYVSVASIGLASTAVAAMEKGTVDAAVMVEPALSQLERRAGGVKLLIDTRTPEGLRALFHTEHFPAMALYARSAWLDDHKELARKLASAVTRALRWVHQHEAAEIAGAMPPAYAGEDRALYQATIATAKRTISADGRMDAQGADALRRMLAVTLPEVASSKLELGETFTNEFLSNDERS